MAQKGTDKFKYGLLKVIDVSGFKVFDPVVRLAFKEEPKKQIEDIAKYMILPIIFVLICFFIWDVVAPKHKTKSGEAPTPIKVWDAGENSKRFAEREDEKQEAFNLTGQNRLEAINETEVELARLEKEKIRLQDEAVTVAQESRDLVKAEIAPVQKKYDALKADYKADQTKRKEAIAVLAEKVATEGVSSDQLVKAIRLDGEQTDEEKDELKVIATEIDEIRANPPEAIKESQLAANKVADEVQHFKKVIDYLTKGNREVKKTEALTKAKEAEESLATAATGKDALKFAKSAARYEEAAVRTDEQKYPRAATIFWQTKRSLATVFVGFVIAAAVAIPVGIMCGLNRVVMACFTPIISIFRPVSPVVWLLIFQIVVGAFFPDPETHPLFVFMNANANPLSFLQTNPAMIFSACTVAMCALWPALVNTALGVSAIDKDHMNVAKVLRLGFWSRLFKIVIPSSLPLVFAGLRISLGVGWMVLIAAEALSSSDGLGKYVWDEYQNGSSQSFANIILACFVVGIIGFFLDRIMIMLQRLVSFDDGSATA
ncbi:ABC transporter permease subunit [Luteolibacter sp. AS25]|uniref:ABC transporter permease n=1 Tax=Luteolibacter sp. AS25 TaxID=3135776 RepID=UPI00398A5979